jgi:YidC/Oxa1 family membrane protein insertase
MERRVLLAIFLCFVVLYGYQALFVKPVPKPPAPSARGAADSAPQAGGTTPAGTSAAPASSVQAVSTTPAAGTTSLVGDTEDRDIRIETPHAVAVFTNRGARLKSWRLKQYRDPQGNPLELIANDLTTQPLPFSLRAADEATTGSLNGALYSVTGAPAADTTQSSPVNVTFEYRDSAGLHAVKTFTLDPGTYTVSLNAAVTQGGQVIRPGIVWGPGLGDSDSQSGRYAVKPGALYSSAGKVTRLAVKTATNFDQEFEYVGIDDHYFTAIALKPGRVKVTYQPLSIPPPANSKDPARDLVGFTIEPSGDAPLTFYVGPKDFDTLAAIDRNLVKAINFGMFSVIVVPLLRSLNWIHGYIGNYGWSILALTILINLVLFPLNHKSVVSMRKMQEIQPETKAIQERYAKLKATDPARQKMNQELMALYRERGVNPASGCVPILLTLPVFLAFYSLLTTAIELRGAPFFGWIHDLSQPDPYYVMPVLVGISQIVTQWMTPQAGVDPTQQKMMMIMPLVLIFVFVSTPSGALIYWLVGNVWRLGQQYLTNYLIGPPNIRTIRPAAERLVKRVGGGKTEGAAREG